MQIRDRPAIRIRRYTAPTDLIKHVLNTGDDMAEDGYIHQDGSRQRVLGYQLEWWIRMDHATGDGGLTSKDH